MKPERRADDAKWEKVVAHMATQTTSMQFVREDVKEMKDSLGGTNVVEMRKVVSGHSAMFNKGKGVMAITLLLWSYFKGLPAVKGWFGG